jgi:hypothetical protein
MVKGPEVGRCTRPRPEAARCGDPASLQDQASCKHQAPAQPAPPAASAPTVTHLSSSARNSTASNRAAAASARASAAAARSSAATALASATANLAAATSAAQLAAHDPDRATFLLNTLLLSAPLPSISASLQQSNSPSGWAARFPSQDAGAAAPPIS